MPRFKPLFVLPAIRLPSPELAPPMRPVPALSCTPMLFGIAAVPVAFVPIRFDCTTRFVGVARTTVLPVPCVTALDATPLPDPEPPLPEMTFGPAGVPTVTLGADTR